MIKPPKLSPLWMMKKTSTESKVDGQQLLLLTKECGKLFAANDVHTLNPRADDADHECTPAGE
jgi:hypothetical protein